MIKECLVNSQGVTRFYKGQPKNGSRKKVNINKAPTTPEGRKWFRGIELQGTGCWDKRG